MDCVHASVWQFSSAEIVAILEDQLGSCDFSSGIYELGDPPPPFVIEPVSCRGEAPFVQTARIRSQKMSRTTLSQINSVSTQFRNNR